VHQLTPYAIPYLQLTDLIVNIFVQVLDEDIALASLTERRVALRPHDTAAVKTTPQVNERTIAYISDRRS